MQQNIVGAVAVAGERDEMIPKVEFKIASIEHMLPPIYTFLNPSKNDWDWSHYILKKYPNLKKELQHIKNTKKRKEIIKNFFTNFLKQNKHILEKKTKIFQKEWNKVNNKFMETLSEILEINWSKKDKKIVAYLSLNPICPRNIKNKTFDMYYNSPIEWMVAGSMHEILHFLYFKKWKKIFPKTDEKEFDSPYLVWHLSEMVPKPILYDKKIQNIHKYKPLVYHEYENIQIKGKSLLKFLQEFYSNRKDFEDFLRKSWNFTKKHEKKIKNI